MDTATLLGTSPYRVGEAVKLTRSIGIACAPLGALGTINTVGILDGDFIPLVADPPATVSDTAEWAYMVTFPGGETCVREVELVPVTAGDDLRFPSEAEYNADAPAVCPGCGREAATTEGGTIWCAACETEYDAEGVAIGFGNA